MKMSSLLSRRGHDLPGVTGTARVLEPGAQLPRRLGAKDIVVADLNRMDGDTARKVVAAEVALVVHSPRDGETTVPRQSFRVFASSTIPVVEVTGATDLVENGTRVRVEDGDIFRLENELAAGRELDATTIVKEVDDAETVLVDSTLAHMANSTEFLSLEHALLLDGEGVPKLDVDFKDRHVLVVTGDDISARQLGDLKAFIREYHPVVIAAGAGADIARKAKVTTDVVVADPTTASDEALTSGAALVIPADRDGRCRELDRITDLGVGGTTFPAACGDRDLALLLAFHGGASMIVVTGEMGGVVGAFPQEGTTANNAPSSTVVDRAVAAKLVHADACASLYRSGGAGVWIALLILTALVAITAIALMQGSLGELWAWFVPHWNNFAIWVQGWVS